MVNGVEIRTEGNKMYITVGSIDMGTITISGIEFLADFVPPLTPGLATKWARMEEKMREYPEEGKNLAEEIAEKTGINPEKKENILFKLWGSYREEGTFSGEKDIWIILYKIKKEEDKKEKLFILILTPELRYAATEIRPSSIESPKPAPVAMENNGLNARYTPPPYLSMDLFEEIIVKIKGLTPPETKPQKTSR